SDPFGRISGSRMYRSGDLGRWRADGSIDFVGRNDRQIKLRGFRIELEEVEAQLARHDLISASAVTVREDVPGQKRLVAYVAPVRPGVLTVADVRMQLKSQLPEYMIPSAFVLMERLPLTDNGKIDRRALPRPGGQILRSRPYEPPVGELEQALAQIW